MKFLFDLLPVILFYGTFKFSNVHQQWAAATATKWLGFMVSGGVVGPHEAATVLATVVVIATIALQVLWLKVRGQPVNKLLLAGLALAVVFGGATIWFHSPEFIKWKFSVLYWLMAVSLLVSRLMWKRNLIQATLGKELELPPQVWEILNLAWVVFLLGMGALNIYVAYNFSEDAWYNFKMFISMGLMFLFILAQGFYISRHVTEPGPEASKQKS